MENTRPITEQVQNQLNEIKNYVGNMYNELEKLREENEELREKLGIPKEANMSKAFDCLAVTNVQVFPFKEGPSLGHFKGLAQVVLNDQLQILGLRVMEGEYGLFVGYPADPFFKGEESRYVVAPITRQLREHIEACVLEKYQQAIGG